KNAADATADGAVRVLGWDGGAAAAGKIAEYTLYFSSTDATLKNLKAELELAVAGATPDKLRYMRFPAGEGLFPTSKWRPGDFVKELYPRRIPPAWAGKPAELRIRFYAEGRPIAVTAARVVDDGKAAVLGDVPIAAP